MRSPLLTIPSPCQLHQRHYSTHQVHCVCSLLYPSAERKAWNTSTNQNAVSPYPYFSSDHLLDSDTQAMVEDQQEALIGSNLDAPNSMLAAAAAADDDDGLTALTTKTPNLEITLGRQSWQKENAEASCEMRLKCL
uniref:Uncharacterized protein n=1 Tax=Musa acuminata subsp. malaccensis TaxID=214687 RepID=A0A804IYQ6_MUSAM